MKKVKRISLFRMNESAVEKKEKQLILGGVGCQCGSCGEWATTDANKMANFNGGITGTGTNDPVCRCYDVYERYAAAVH